jgi:hypothetical protein
MSHFDSPQAARHSQGRPLRRRRDPRVLLAGCSREGPRDSDRGTTRARPLGRRRRPPCPFSILDPALREALPFTATLAVSGTHRQDLTDIEKVEEHPDWRQPLDAWRRVRLRKLLNVGPANWSAPQFNNISHLTLTKQDIALKASRISGVCCPQQGIPRVGAVFRVQSGRRCRRVCRNEPKTICRINRSGRTNGLETAP